MNSEEFEKIIYRNPNLKHSLREVLHSVTSREKTRGVFEDTASLASIVALFPLVVFIVKEIGLPWLHEVKRYSDLWRENFHAWVNLQYQEYGRDPVATKAAGDALRSELEKLVDDDVKKSWEHLAELLDQESISDSED